MSQLAGYKQKTCSKCRKEKPEHEFCIRRDAPDGRFYDCRECTREYRKENKRTISRQKAKSYIDNRESVLCRVKKYRESDSGRSNKAKTNAKYRSKNKEKISAHHAVNNAVRSGRIVRGETCEDCGGISSTHGHHDDYTKKLEVRWLCEPCHTLHHTGVIR